MSFVKLVLCVVILIIIIKFCYRLYKYKHPEKYYGGKVYRAKLVSITPEIKVYNDLSREQNIINAEERDVTDILVQETSNKYYCREVITGKLIPVSYAKYMNYEGYYEFKNYEHCVFVRIDEIYFYITGFFWRYGSHRLYDISAENLEKYIAERKGKYKARIYVGKYDYEYEYKYKEFDSFKDYIDYILSQGEKFYKDSQAKGEISDDKKNEEILEELKANQ